MKISHKIFLRTTAFIRNSRFVHYFSIKDDGRETAPFKLIFFCGSKGINYLNASLISVYKCWEKLPEVCIVSDGSPVDKMKEALIKWPKNVEIISWEECATFFKNGGNTDLYNYASSELLGKKLTGIMYYAAKFPVLYSDSDILWFNSPVGMGMDFNQKPQIKMCEDVGHFYKSELLEHLGEEKCLKNTPFNSGAVFANGEFSSYPKWSSLCNYLGANKNMGWFSEQTSFAILKNYFKPGEYFKLSEILIKVDDEFSLKYTKKTNPDILARHYVNIKDTTFWRDFVYMFFSRK